MTTAVDTMVLIWGFPRPGAPRVKPEDAEKRRRARILMDMLNEEGETIIVPTMVVAELLTPLKPAQRDRFLSIVTSKFRCPPFDIRAAAIAADLLAEHANSKVQYNDRRLLKSDVTIIATAKSAGATVFYSHDEKARKLAARIMEARDLPTRHPNMFIDQEFREAGN